MAANISGNNRRMGFTSDRQRDDSTHHRQSGRQYAVRLLEAMSHTSRYAFEGKMRLVRDTGLGKMTVLRLLSGDHNPSYFTVHTVVAALEKALGRTLDIRDLISYTGKFDRPICEVVGCRGCLPDGIVGDDGSVAPAHKQIKPGSWMCFGDFEPPRPGDKSLMAGGTNTPSHAALMSNQ